VKKGAPFKGSQPKGDVNGKPRGACFNCNEVGHYSKDCPKLKLGNGASKVIALTSNLGQGECNRLIFLKGKFSKQEVLCLLDIGALTRSQVTRGNSLEGFTKSSCRKLNLVARSRLSTLERGRGSSWEPRD